MNHAALSLGLVAMSTTWHARADEAPNASATTASATTAGATTSAPAAPRPVTVTGSLADDVKERVTFGDAVSRALTRNPSALTAAEEIHRAESLLAQTRAASLPVLGAQGAYTRLDADRTSGGVVVVSKSALNLNVGLNAPLVNLRGWTQWEQAGDQVDVAKASADDVKRVLAVATARAYLTVIAQKRILQTATIARDAAKAHYEFTHAQRVGGVGNRLDELRAAQELTTDEANVQNQVTALLRAREALGVLVAGSGPMDAASDEISQQPMPMLSDAMNGAEKARADVIAKRLGAEAAERRVNQAWADYMPALNLLASPFYNTPATTTLPETGWQAELVLSLPLYDGGLRYGQEHERKALAEEARQALDGTIRQARSEARTAFEEVLRADAALAQSRDAAAFGKEVLTLATIAYKAGATSNLEVIDAERQARDTEAAAAIAEDAARQARLDLLAASGRFP